MILHPLTPARLTDWLAFFDGPAFGDNPEWAQCYCRCFVFGRGGAEGWDAACAARGANRAAMAEAVGAGAIDGMMAYHDGRVVGWLHFGPADRFCSPVGTRFPAEPGDAAVVCFVVDPEHRRAGVARALLRRTLDELRARGFTRVWARAAMDDDDASASGASHHFTGPIGLYRSEGFVPDGPEPYRLRLVRAL